MELGFSLYQSNLIHVCKSRRCLKSEFFHLPKNVGRFGSVSGCSVLKLPFGRDFRGHMWGFPRREISTLGIRCQSSDDTVYLDRNGRNVELGKDSKEESLREDDNPTIELSVSGGEKDERETEEEVPTMDELRESLQKARKELEVARMNSAMFEEKAQNISETAFALKDKAENARLDVDRALEMIEEVVNEELNAKEAVQKATMTLSLAEARLQVAMESVKASRIGNGNLSPEGALGRDTENESEEEETLLVTQEEIKECKLALEKCEVELIGVQNKKEELQKEVNRLKEVAERAQMNALKAEDDVANVMLLAEKAVALELEASQRVSDAEIALQRAEKRLSLSSSQADVTDSADHQGGLPSLNEDVPSEEEILGQETSLANGFESEKDVVTEVVNLSDSFSDTKGMGLDDATLSDGWGDKEMGKLGTEANKDGDVELEKVKNTVQTKKGETRDSSPSSTPKASLKKSSRFFSASFFSFDDDCEEFAPSSVFRGLMDSAKKQMPKLIVGLLLFGAGVTFYLNRGEKGAQLLQQPDIVITSLEEVSSKTDSLIDRKSVV